MRILKAQLPALLKRLNTIPEPRNPKKIKHSLTLLMLYGLFMFVFQLSSRRQANSQMTRPQFKENLRLLFPELDDLPHADTLFRLLSKIDVDQIESALVELIKRLIAKKKFHRYLMRLAHVFNSLAHFSSALAPLFREMGVRGFIAFVYNTLTGPWLVPKDVKERLNRPFQLRLE